VSSSTWGATGSLGWRVVVQSEKNPVYLENRVDVFFDEHLKKLLEDMSNEEFEQKRQGLIDKKLEKFKNLGEETSSFWSQISDGYHDFMRRTRDAEILQTVTREEVYCLFMEKVHPSSKTRSKLSIHMQSQTASNPPSPKFSIAASKAFLEALRSKAVVVKEDDYNRLSAAQPPLSAVKMFWSNHFKTVSHLSESDTQYLLKRMETLTKEHPAEGSVLEAEVTAGQLGDDVVHVKDMAAFKAQLTISKAATPVEIYNDIDSKL